MVVVFGAGFLVGRMTASQGTIFTGSSKDSTNVAGQSNNDQNTAAAVDEGGTTIDSSNMTEGQRKLISALGGIGQREL